ncbi:protein of unknown function [Clostridium amylolyticum]|uniref:DUF4179 domain-containing protein n=1 Tax=Clostridium amylolyticum TaxID=1121298 RepID=A0A1M6F968_9CLOT|nr:DUF4179 domain-containing protein [Clostridium amylolyticum]SHI94206.1 protein of unknown function [Clostridium amylolyticum]
MFDREEETLMRVAENINQGFKSSDIDEYIKSGISLGKKKKRRAKMRMYTSVVALFTFIMLITSIRISPAFAYYVSKVPGFNYIVKLINYDKGIKDAVDNNFVEQINASQEHDDIVFTIKDIIIDNSKAIIFYSIENKGDHRFVNLHNMSFKDEKEDESTIAGSGWSYFINKDMNIYKKLEESVEIDFNEKSQIPETLLISIKLKESKGEGYSENSAELLPYTWDFKIHIDKKKFEDMSKRYTLNKNIEIEGQRIIFKALTITPTRMALEIEYDKNNTKKILGFDDIEIVDENGENRSTIINGISGTKIDDYNEIIYFQSNYFADPKELYIKGSSIRALDKDKCTVEIDIENNKLLKAPDDKFILNSVNKGDKELILDYKVISNDPKDKDNHYNSFHNGIKDSNGKIYQEHRGTSSSSSSVSSTTSYITIDSKIKSPIYLNISNYPAWIKGDFKIKVK